MAKKRSSKTASQTPENPVVKKDKLLSTQKKPGGEIDDIFSGKKSDRGKAGDPKIFGNEIEEIFSSKKRKKPESEKKEGGHIDATSKKSRKKNSQSRNNVATDVKGSVDMPTRPKKRTADGLAIYTEEELGFGKAEAGGTRLCPFDCDCCF